jgi:hypothetical protein
VTRGRWAMARLASLSPRYTGHHKSDGHLRDHYNAALSSISILYGVVRILRMLSAMSASEEQAGLSDRNHSTNSLGSREMPKPKAICPVPAQIPNSQISTVTS